VEPVRLVLHLSLALALYVSVLWLALDTHARSLAPAVRFTTLRPATPPALRWLTRACVGCIALTIVAGGFVAGLHAGLTYNTFPLMDGHLVPEGYAAMTPFAANLIENVAAVQFDHRALATVTLIVVTLTACLGFRTSRAFALFGLIVLGQYALGVATLLNVVPVPLAVAHQAGAVLLLTAAIVALHSLRSPRRVSGRTARTLQRIQDPS
jgi:cytochrome c oxidase assembly protein subunit 15